MSMGIWCRSARLVARTIVVAVVIVAAAASAPYAEAVTVTLNFMTTPDPNSGQLAVAAAGNDVTNCIATQA